MSNSLTGPGEARGQGARGPGGLGLVAWCRICSVSDSEVLDAPGCERIRARHALGTCPPAPRSL
eukprot:2400500-Pyramimonas_sp.AAC.1